MPASWVFGKLPHVAHNAEFDMGFMSAVARRHGISFAPTYMDTLILSQSLLHDLKRFKLDLVSNRLGLPDFNHHRADDDAYACGRIMARLIEMLAEKGITRRDQLEAFTRAERNEHMKNQRARHHSSG